MKKLALSALLLATGCAPQHKPSATKVIVPKNCMRISISSFTKPCKEIGKGQMRCDGVIIDVDCIKVVPQ